MNFKSLVVSVFTIGLSLHQSFGQTTETPKVEEQSADYVKIKRVELTDKYTIIYLQFNESGAKSTPSVPPELPDDYFQSPKPNSSTIRLDPETRLYKPGVGDRAFKLIRAENIPTDKSRKVAPGEKVDFVAYFEKLSPGIEIFDFYEGRSTREMQSWNFYGVHIKNPLKKQPVASPGKITKAPAPSKKPLPVQKEEAEPGKAEDRKPDGDEILAAVRGTVYNSKTKEPISARISYLKKGDTLQISSSSGKYQIGMNPKEKYELRVAARGFYGTSASIAAADSAGKRNFTQDFFLTPLVVGEAIALPGIYFETSQYTLLSESAAELNQLVQMMKENPETGIRVEGHTDNVGDADKNIELSKKRAESVRDFLIKKGIDGSRIEARGYGATRIYTKSGSEEERRKNRRVELVVTKI